MNRRHLLGVSCALAILSACSVPASDARFSEQLPDRESFPVVAQMLVHTCGTLDCHGMTGRNLRLFGNEGLRFAATDSPLMPACTTSDEIEQDYDAVVGLEPEVMSTVIADAGANPERLSLVRKARGAEHHKGGTVIHVGDDADGCLNSWLAGATNPQYCLRAQIKSDCFAQP